jgi:beta-glucosidase
MSDWFITKSTLSAVTGLDMMMPGDITVNLDGLGSGGYEIYFPEPSSSSDVR